MKRLLFVAALIVLPVFALAQQVASHQVCSLAFDGGTTTSTATCPPLVVNFQPETVVCQVATSGSHVVGTAQLLVSNDGINYANIVDGGYSFAFNQDVNAVTSAAFAMSPTNPWQYSEVQAALTINDGGTTSNATLNCEQSVVQSQTIHLHKK